MMKKCLITLFTAYAALSAAPQAIVFDFGGVLIQEPNREIVVQFLRNSFHLTAEEFDRVNSQKKKSLQTGKKDEDFWIEYAKEKGINLPKDWNQEFKKIIKQSMGINKEMFEFVEQLKQTGLPVALLSNVDPRLARFIRESGLYEPFHPCLLSCEIGLEKPDPKIYEYLLDSLKLPAKDVVFIDDQPENVKVAKQLGLDAILFESQTQLKDELTARGIVL